MVLNPRNKTMPEGHDERGAVAIIVAVMAVMLFVVAALVVDLGLARDTKRQSQSAADASALAAGNALYDFDNGCSIAAPCITEAVAEAKSYALENFGVALSEWDTCADPAPLATVPGPGSCISFDLTPAIKNVRVIVPTETVQTGLGTVAGIDEIDISTIARAAVDPRPALPCGLCILGSGVTHNLQNGDAFVDNGNAHFNGNVNVSANGLVVADGSITVEGTATGPLSNYTPDPSTGADPIEDPLAYIDLPPDMTGLVARSNPCADGPGIYSGDKNLRNATCELQPGLYIIRSGIWDLAGNSSTILKGTGVTLYFTCSSGSVPRECNANESGASMDFSGNGQIQITGPTSGPLQGLALVYDRNNAATLKMTGNGAANMTGAIYAPGAKLLVNGNGCAGAYNSVVIVKELEFNGNPACLRVDYNAAFNPASEYGRVYLDQ